MRRRIVHHRISMPARVFHSKKKTKNCRRTDEEGRLLEDYDEGESPVSVTSSEARRDETTRHEWRRRVILAAVIAFPTLIALATDDVLMLASLTGSYPGVGVQFVIPSLLVVYARRFVLFYITSRRLTSIRPGNHPVTFHTGSFALSMRDGTVRTVQLNRPSATVSQIRPTKLSLTRDPGCCETQNWDLRLSLGKKGERISPYFDFAEGNQLLDFGF